jgi:hypothetical protein
VFYALDIPYNVCHVPFALLLGIGIHPDNIPNHQWLLWVTGPAEQPQA